MKASDLFVHCLQQEGVEYVFAVPGEENLDLLESLRTSKIKVIVNRHEQCAAFMAATYGRLTGKAGVCLATLGPGATNLVTGMAHAHLGGMPMVAITGQKGIRENFQASFQVLDIVNMMRPLTKRAVQIHGPKSIPKEIRTAFKLATTERHGVCHIELPEDIAHEQVDEKFASYHATTVRRPIADEKAIATAADMIKSAKNPILIVSSRAQRRSVSAAIKSFCNATGLYVVHTQLGKGVLGDDHAQSLYAFGIHKKDYVHCIVEKADLIVTVGYSVGEHPPSVWNRDMNKKILHLDFTPAEVDIYYNPTWEVIGDIGQSLESLTKQLNGYHYAGSYEKKVKTELTTKLLVEEAENSSFPLRPRRIVKECRAVLGKEDIICLDNGIYKLWFSRHYPTYNIGTFLLDNALATMGAGLPSAMTAKLLYPQKRVLAVCGDGGFMMNSQELETAVRLKLNIVVLILNDNAYGFIKWKQQNAGFKDFSLDYSNPDFVKYAEAYGAKGYKVTKAEELGKILEKAFGQKGPVLIECPIDYSENNKVWGEELGNILCPL
ncbi:acetolactate synthase large subunit [Candidatus Woesearchaeota archaeon]|nr:acetolactate synthase large subunit [Candidatus Woesearchaeota archaeon]